MTKIKELGEAYPATNSSIIDIDISAHYGMEFTLFDNYKEVYIVTEIKVLDDGDSQFYSKLYGVSIIKVNSRTRLTEEQCIYFERPSDVLIDRFESGEADIYPSSSILVSVSTDDKNKPAEFTLSKRLESSYFKELRSYYSSIARAPILDKLLTIYRFLRANDANNDSPDDEAPPALIAESKRRVQFMMEGSIWAAAKYLIPYERSNKRIYVKVQGFLNLDEDIVFCRFFVNPDPRNRMRKLYPAGLPNWDSYAIYQKLDAVETVLDLPDIDETYSLMFDVVKVKFDTKKTGAEAISFQEEGLSIYPLCTSDGFMNFGRILVPIFNPTLDWDSVEEFSSQNTWDVLEVLLSNQENVEMTNRYIFLSVRDEYRKVELSNIGILRSF